MTPIKSYYRIMAGKGCMYAAQCFEQGFIGVDWAVSSNLSDLISDSSEVFNDGYLSLYHQANPDSNKIAAGLARSATFNICKKLLIGDIVLCPSGSGIYYVGEVTSDYYFVEGEVLPHRRKINWYDKAIKRNDMSAPLKNSAGSVGTLSDLSKYAEELDNLLEGKAPPALTHSDELVEDPSVFALEKHLEEFLVANWQSTELGKNFDIYSLDGEVVGQQFPSDTGPLDILAISKDKQTLLVVELKRGRASDSVVGQIQRYMGYVQDELCEESQTVKGVIIALEDDLRLRRALSVAQNIEFYRYQLSFKLNKHTG
jgi:restriction system protein